MKNETDTETEKPIYYYFQSFVTPVKSLIVQSICVISLRMQLLSVENIQSSELSRWAQYLSNPTYSDVQLTRGAFVNKIILKKSTL